MIVADTSALVAILQEEADATLFAEAIADADPPFISTATVVELGVAMRNRYGAKSARMVDALLREAGFQVEAVTSQQAGLAIEAYANWGKGQKSAGLNYGDCFSYALAKAMDLPLLFKGRDFSRTDIRCAL
jgi:ribonuclease VapC